MNPSDVGLNDISSNYNSAKFIKFNIKQIQCFSDQQIFPWITNQTRLIEDPLLRFHNQIIQFYDYVGPNNQSSILRMNSFKKIQKIILQLLPNAQVKIFGSLCTNLYLPDSDIDVAIIMKQTLPQSNVYSSLYKHLNKYDKDLKNITYIWKTKVPIIKFVEKNHQIAFDLSINKFDGINQISNYVKIDRKYGQFKYLILVLKCILRIRGMSEPYKGGIGSYLLFCMLTVYLQEIYKSDKCYLLSEHLLKFLQFYSFGKMDRMTGCISKELIPRPREPFTISILSPQDQSIDLGKAAHNSFNILKMFKNRYNFITNHNFSLKESILQYLVNPNSQIFAYIRKSP